MTSAMLSRSLHAAAAVLALVGVAALAWPARLDVASRPLVIAPPPAMALDTTAGDASALVAAVVQANVFSSTRRPPTTRYVPEGMTGDVADVADEPTEAAPLAVPLAAPPSSLAADSADAEPSAASPVPRLFGIVSDPQGLAALLRLDPRTPGARAYHAGDRGGAYRVVRVEGDAVVLDGPGGRRTLRLAAPSSPR